MPQQRKLTEIEEMLARELGQDLAEKTQASLMDPDDSALNEDIREIRKQVKEMGLEIRCSRIITIDAKDPGNLEIDVEVTLYLPPLIN